MPGYLGSTGHSASLLNNKGLVGDEWSNEPPLSSQEWRETCENEGLIRFGATILAWLPCRRLCDETLSRYFRITLAVTSCKPIYEIYIRRFWETYGTLMEDRTSQNLTAVSKSLCKNTATFRTGKDLEVPKSTSEFLDSFSGAKSRWDMFGSIIIAIGFVALSLPPTDPFLCEILPQGMLVKDYGASLLEVADACLMLCDELDVQSNLLSLLLMYKCVCYQAVVGGDISSSLWKRMGSLTAASMFSHCPSRRQFAY